MPMHYMNPDDASNPNRLPNIETFQAVYGECPECGVQVTEIAAPTADTRKACPTYECQMDEVSVALEQFGWFYWFCLPGCMPDSEPIGPFDTEEAALEHARED